MYYLSDSEGKNRKTRFNRDSRGLHILLLRDAVQTLQLGKAEMIYLVCKASAGTEVGEPFYRCASG